jgi:DNA-binding transcriptional LysR family regulator
MERQDLNDILYFLAVAEEKSFTKAAAKLGTSQSTLSHTIKQLEGRLGLRLLNRTTRNVTPTEAGERLFNAFVPRLRELEGELEDLMAIRDKPAGLVRITLSDHARESVVWPKLRPLLLDYPDIKLELNIDNGFRDIVEERFDAGVRLGESLDKDMVAVPIGPDWRLVAVGAPSYFAMHPMPEVPQDLVSHVCINTRQSRSGGLYAWEFEKDGRELRVRVDGQITLNSSAAQVEAAVAGYGIAYVPENLAEREIAEGRLVQVLDDWCPMFTGYYLYYPSRRQNSAAFSLITNALRIRAE